MGTPQKMVGLSQNNGNIPRCQLLIAGQYAMKENLNQNWTWGNIEPHRLVAIRVWVRIPVYVQ